jgi:hypothetical protein
MTMAPGVRTFALVAHVTSSVGWLGAVAAFLVLSVAGLTSERAETVRGAYVAMNLIGAQQRAWLPLVRRAERSASPRPCAADWPKVQ